MADSYLQSKVMTASQPQLQLMLLEGALKHGRTARATFLDADQQVRHQESLSRTLDILETLVQGAAQGKHELSQSVEEQFAFLFREAAAAQVFQDVQKLDKVLDLLAFHRETWQLACQQLKGTATEAREGAANSAASLAASQVIAQGLAAEVGSFSLEA